MKITLTTTFKQLHDAEACKSRYRHLAKQLGGVTKYGRTKPINLLTILEHNGLADFFWCLRILEDNQIFRAMAADFAESVLPIYEKKYPGDRRPRKAIEAARKFVHNEITMEQLSAARAAAWTAARAAAGAAAGAAAWAAAWAATGTAAGDAAGAAAGAAAWDAAGDAAWDAEREKQIHIIRKYLK